MTKEEFIKYTNELGINLTPEMLNSLECYCEFLLEYNKTTNLTSITNPNQVYLKHFYDSLTLVKAVDILKINNILDIGTGAGFPGIVLKICFPHLKLTLLDSNNKKIKFLTELVQKLNLPNVEIINQRAEEFIKNNREKYEITTARAVANLATLSEICLPFVKEGFYFIPLKGSNEEEIKNAQDAIEILGGKIEKIIKLELPNQEGIRNIIKIKKISKTSVKYPRRYDKIVKNPLKKQ